VQLPGFEYLEPRDLSEALELLDDYGADCAVLAGGTDLIVRMKQRLKTPRFLMSLKHLKELAYVREADGFLKIGSATPLAAITASEIVKLKFSGFHHAVESVGALSIQHFRGTIGGNLCQDNRCRFYNQSAFFRSARQACHKAGGSICYAREGSDRCRSTCQSDAAPALVALDAVVTLRNAGSERTLPLMDFYTAIGDAPLALHNSELLTEISLPLTGSGSGSAYRRLAYRSVIDYPIVSAAAYIKVVDKVIREARIVVGAIGSAPLFLLTASRGLNGKPVDDGPALSAAAEMARNSAAAFIVDNIHSTMEYRTEMISVLVLKALKGAIENALTEEAAGC
jgi:CO/xanthine dehydrogenase FAD-binding subunit